MTNDTLIPKYDSSSRQSIAVAATFNLTATMLGRGVLSLPLAFEKCGVVLGSLLMVTFLITTERSLNLLCIGARKSGATTHGEVGKAAFGTQGEYDISMILLVYPPCGIYDSSPRHSVFHVGNDSEQTRGRAGRKEGPFGDPIAHDSLSPTTDIARPTIQLLHWSYISSNFAIGPMAPCCH